MRSGPHGPHGRYAPVKAATANTIFALVRVGVIEGKLSFVC